MTWPPHQRKMLAEMGIHLWMKEKTAPVPVPVPVPQEKTLSRPVGHPLPQGGEGMKNSVLTPSSACGREAEERAISPAHMDWPQLQAAVAQCTACSLCKSRQNPVFGMGNPQAHVMVIGEAPGEQEDRQGKPFVGKSGQLLDNMLATLRLTRADDTPECQVFIANVLKCRPPLNRNPQPEEVLRCEPFLLRQVQLVQPRVILALGRFAIESLLRTKDPVGRLRGRVHRYADTPVIVSYHPAYLLRQPQEKAKAWEDLCLLREVISA